MKRTKVFISYSHKDKQWLEQLQIHLKPLERELGFDIWDDTRIKSGAKWREEIERVLDVTKVAVLLVSANYLASDFIANNELPSLLKAAEEDGAIILPVILSPSLFLRMNSLSQFQAINDPSEPLVYLTEAKQQTLFVKIADCIESSLNLEAKTESTNKTAKPRIRINSKKPIIIQVSTKEFIIGRDEG